MFTTFIQNTEHFKYIDRKHGNIAHSTSDLLKWADSICSACDYFVRR